MSKETKKEHVYLPELREQLHRGDIDRREFLRTATLLGVSASAAYAMAGAIDGQWLGKPAAAAEMPKAGGTLRCSMRVQEMTDPATFDWTQRSNQARQIVEYVTVTGSDNITRPYLAESWLASDDLKTWTFKFRKGIKWSNGDAFGADDVKFNIERWLDPEVGSSNKSLFSAVQQVEKVDDLTLKLHLKSAVLQIPENFYNYPTAIVHRRFTEEGGNLAKNPVGTGPYEMTTYRVGELFVLKRRNEPYWGGDIYLDEIRYIDHGDTSTAGIAAMKSNQVDMLYGVDVNEIELISRMDHAVLHEGVTAQTGVARMQVTQKPFDDLRVRQAVVSCFDHAAILKIAYRGKGAIGENHHVSPIHPEYAKLPPLKRDIAKAKQLLADAGHGGGLTVKVDYGGDAAWHAAAMQTAKQQLAPAGINLQLNPMPGATYWDVWDKTPFGFTSWTHRPLGVMVLNLGYRSGVPWNESKYANPAFDTALDEASGILDPNERAKAMVKVEKILQDDAVIAQPLWRSIFTATTKQVRGYQIHPTQYHQFHKVWMA